MLKQHLQFKLSQKLSPQQIQLMKLIQLPIQSFEQHISREIEENPALATGKEDQIEQEEFSNSEEDNREIIEADDIDIDAYLSDDEIPEYRLRAQNYSADDEDKHVPYAAGISFHQQLMAQLDTFTFTEHEYRIASFLVGSIDTSGYIRQELIDIVDDLAFTENIYTNEDEVKKVLQFVQQLDPPGVGALDLQDCLLIQLRRKIQSPAITTAISILKEQFEAFTKKHFDKIKNRFKIDDEQLKSCMHEIEKLNPKPGSAFGSDTKINAQIVPDFTIQLIDGQLNLMLNGRNAPELHVSTEYRNMLSGYKEAKQKNKEQQKAVQFIKQKLDAARWFIDAIKQRQHTLYETMKTIMDFQQDYFFTGDEQMLKPMILKDIADRIGMDISTVSRVANSKYVDTPYGTKLVKWFFSEGIKNAAGEEVSSIEVKKVLEDVIAEEDKTNPLTDEKLMSIMNKKGYPIARRTVAKYREMIGAPVARLRKEL
ncbi:MAG: RNA polymerase sigma-54 factor [Gammaproteobacteria bacterium]|nr:RNA polymerase sigma-54 factor [Gammaproteobacteria bacterium]